MAPTIYEAIEGHSQPRLRRRIEVPEWSMDGGETPLVVQYDMVTLDDLQQANELGKGGALNLIAPYLVVLKALDETGARMFKMGDATWLRENAAPDVLQRIALNMMARANAETARGN